MPGEPQVGAHRSFANIRVLLDTYLHRQMSCTKVSKLLNGKNIKTSLDNEQEATKNLSISKTEHWAL